MDQLPGNRNRNAICGKWLGIYPAQKAYKVCGQITQDFYICGDGTARVYTYATTIAQPWCAAKQIGTQSLWQRVGNVFKHIRTKDAVEGIIGQWKRLIQIGDNIQVWISM